MIILEYFPKSDDVQVEDSIFQDTIFVNALQGKINYNYFHSFKENDAKDLKSRCEKRKNIA